VIARTGSWCTRDVGDRVRKIVEMAWRVPAGLNDRLSKHVPRLAAILVVAVFVARDHQLAGAAARERDVEQIRAAARRRHSAWIGHRVEAPGGGERCGWRGIVNSPWHQAAGPGDAAIVRARHPGRRFRCSHDPFSLEWRVILVEQPGQHAIDWSETGEKTATYTGIVLKIDRAIVVVEGEQVQRIAGRDNDLRLDLPLHQQI
jgi:hypothetical protein